MPPVCSDDENNRGEMIIHIACQRLLVSTGTTDMYNVYVRARARIFEGCEEPTKMCHYIDKSRRYSLFTCILFFYSRRSKMVRKATALYGGVGKRVRGSIVVIISLKRKMQNL